MCTFIARVLYMAPYATFVQLASWTVYIYTNLMQLPHRSQNSSAVLWASLKPAQYESGLYFWCGIKKFLSFFAMHAHLQRN